LLATIFKYALILSILSAASACRTRESSLNEAPSGDNDPKWWGLDTMVYNDLPASYFLTSTPWASDNWPTVRGGISYRWQNPQQTKNYRNFLYQIPSAAELATMQDQQIDALSPAEKYDLWMGRSDLTSKDSVTGRQRAFMLDSVQYNIRERGVDEIPFWTGICNGWSLAAINEPYPAKAVRVTSPSGRSINFYGADIQALISQVYFDYQPGINIARLGALCSDPTPAVNADGRITSPECRDANPMSFHLALGKVLSKGQSFVIDINPSTETINQPAVGYSLSFSSKKTIPSDYKDAASNATQLVDVKVDFYYTLETMVGKESFNPKQMAAFIKSIVYEYRLELDDNDNVVGGEWAKGSNIPDFLWRPSEMPSDRILFGLDASYPLSYDKVKELVNAAAK
jgi:hypothetical protein